MKTKITQRDRVEGLVTMRRSRLGAQVKLNIWGLGSNRNNRVNIIIYVQMLSWPHLNWNIQYISISLVLRWSRLVEAWCHQSQEWAKCTFESYCCIKRLYKIHFNKVFIKLFSSIWYFGTFIWHGTNICPNIVSYLFPFEETL